MPTEELITFDSVYTPGMLLGIYSNAIRTGVEAKLIIARGIFQIQNNQTNYGGYYYDILKSIDENRSIKTKIGAQLRTSLSSNTVYVFKGYIEKKINFSSIELILVVNEVMQKDDTALNPEELRRFDVLQKKAQKGYRDVELCVKDAIYNDRKLKVANLYGNTAIVDRDFNLGISNATIYFEIQNFKCNMQSKSDLRDKILHLDNQVFDLIAVIRGGGDTASLEIFNEPDLCNSVYNLKSPLITALGHAANESLLDKIADKKFALPHDYGNSLKVWVDEAIEHKTKSKSIFIEQVKTDLQKTFQDQIATLTNQLANKNKEVDIIQAKFKEVSDQSQKDKAEILLSKQKEFEAGIKSLNEQIKAKDDSLRVLTINNQETIQNQVAAATSILDSKLDNLSRENDKLQGRVSKIWIYVIIALIAGFVLANLIK